MAEGATSDRFAQVKGFQVDIDGAGGKDHDVAWEHVSGGALMIEHVETTIGADKHHTNTPGQGQVGDITLRGAMTDTRGALCQWLNLSQGPGPKPRRTVSIAPLLQLRGDQVPRRGRVHSDKGTVSRMLESACCGVRDGPSARPANRR